MSDMSGRVVVTGLGVVSSIGLNKDEFWKGLLEGRSGISKVEPDDPEAYEASGLGEYIGEIKNFDFEAFFPDHPEQYPRAAQMALVSAREALGDACFPLEDGNFRVGVAFGTTMGEAQVVTQVSDVMESEGKDKVPEHLGDFYFAPKITTSLGAAFNLYGPNIMLTNACAAGSVALSYGFEKIRSGVADAMLVGGTDAFSRTALGGFSRMGAVADGLPRPFDAQRTGMIVAEGAGSLIIESLEHALARKAPIYSEVLDYGLSCDAHHITRLHLPGLVHGMRQALDRSGVKPEDVSYISVHGTGTKANDATEAAALREVFGEQLNHIPISSIKSMLGHSMGAASALECVASNMAIRHGVLPPTANFRELDPEFEKGLDVVPNQGREHRVEVVLKTASAFGGNNCAIVFRKYREQEARA